ncbi:MAG: porin [Pseudomonadota bacterium]
MQNFKRFSPLVSGVVLATVFGGAHAQTSATLYGIVDAGLRFSSGLDASYGASATSSQAINSGIDNTSRIGIRGTEDLGGGMKALFNLESGINIDAGSTVSATKLFDRAAVVGLQAGWGTLTFGRQTTVLADALGIVDPLTVRFPSFTPTSRLPP